MPSSRLPDAVQDALQGLSNATDQSLKAAGSSPKAQEVSVVGYIKDMAMDKQGSASSDVVQLQLQVMSACFQELCHEVPSSLPCPQPAAT